MSAITGYPTGYTGATARSTAGYGSVIGAAWKIQPTAGAEIFTDSFVGTSSYGMVVCSLSMRAA